MKPNPDKIDEAVLALPYLTSFTEGKEPFRVTRAWKSHDLEALDVLYEKGLIGDSKSKSKSVLLADQGRQRAEELFERLFCD